MAKFRILVAEDELDLRALLRVMLENEGFDVVEAADGTDALALARSEAPDLALLDVMMPGLDGNEVCRLLRASYETRHIPVIMLTARAAQQDKVRGLEHGANDYVTKPWNNAELLLRIRNALEWSAQQRSASPLTGLPGNHAIGEELRRRIESGTPFALLQVDVDHFKAFNDHYGYVRGDQAIQLLARILVAAAQRQGAFVGHIGGDDFVVIAPAGDPDSLGEWVIETFDAASRGLYDPVDRDRGWIDVLNRRHESERIPLMSLTIAMVSTDRVPVTHLGELADITQELKARGKAMPGSVLIGERRRRDEGPRAGRHAA